MTNKKKQYVKIKGKVNYYTPNRRSSYSTEEQPKYEIQLCNIDDFDYNADALATFDTMGVKTRRDDAKYPDRGQFITSSSQYPIGTLDASKQPIPEDLGIGNGTEVIALFEMYPTPKSPDFNFGLGIRKVQIVDLVPYEKKESKEDSMAALFDTVEGGFTAPAPSAVDALDDEIPFD